MPSKPKPIQTRKDLIEFYIRQALEQASWAKPEVHWKAINEPTEWTWPKGKKASTTSGA